MSPAYPRDLSFAADSRVVLVGTTRCPRDMECLPPLPQVAGNVRRLQQLLTDPELVGLPEEAVVTLLDIEYGNQIAEHIAEVAAAATDTLIVYYAGHGLYGDPQTALYLAAVNSTDRGKANNAVPIDQVKRAVSKSPARKRILILDCCYSGRAFEGLMSPQTAEAAIRPAIDVDGTFGIAAAGPSERAYAPPGKELTRFTGALIKVLERGITGEQSVLTLERVFKEVETDIRRFADAPLPRRVNGDRMAGFQLARNRSFRAVQPEARTVVRQVFQIKAALGEGAAANNRLLNLLDEDPAATAEALREANSLDPKNRTIPGLLLNAEINAGSVEGTVQAIKKLIAHDPQEGRAAVRAILGASQMRRNIARADGDANCARVFQDRMRVLARAWAQAEPDYPDALQSLAITLIEAGAIAEHAGDNRGACDAYEEAFRLMRVAVELLTALGDGRTQPHRKSANNLNEYDFNFAAAAYYWARVLDVAGEAAKAVSLREQVRPAARHCIEYGGPFSIDAEWLKDLGR